MIGGPENVVRRGQSFSVWNNPISMNYLASVDDKAPKRNPNNDFR